MPFQGLSKQGIDFLKDLAVNNNKGWFELHRNTYETFLLNPLKELTAVLAPAIKAIDPKIETTPTINKAISRIYRDTRFSNDKSPYRSDAWISFRRPNKIWGNVPEFYFYFTPEEYQYGMGFYAATPSNMSKIRDQITSDPDRFMELIREIDNTGLFVLLGDEYKKPVSNDLPDKFQLWFKKKNLCMSHLRKIDNRFYSLDLKDDIEKSFNVNAGLYTFLMDSINQ